MSDTVVEGNQEGAFQALLAAPWLGLLRQTASKLSIMHGHLLHAGESMFDCSHVNMKSPQQHQEHEQWLGLLQLQHKG